MIGETFSHYKIVEKLGEGGMGVVYKAEDTKLQRTVALKFLPARNGFSEDEQIWLMEEAQSAARLNHPNICVIYSVEDDDEKFIVMEYVEGITLREKIARGALPIAQSIGYAIQIAEALHEAHGKGIVHRDIKADNIMVNVKNQVKVMDFGLAKLNGSTTSTKTGRAPGTLAYMSPEQARGEDVDAATDIWSFGVLLYELLTGRRPFSHEYEAAIVYSLLNETPVPPRELREDISEVLENIVLKCLRKNPVERYPSAKILAQDLHNALGADSLSRTTGIGVEKKTGSKKETEQKVATILSMFLPGYAEIVATEEPEETYSIMEHVREIVESTAKKFEGTLNRISAGETVILFGLPEAIEGAEEKAVRAGMDIRKGLQSLGKSGNMVRHLNPAISIDTGLVISGSLGTDGANNYVVVGDPMDLSGKLVRIAQKGQIIVGPLTHKYTKELFEYRRGPSVSIRSNKEGVPCFELIGTKQRQQLKTVPSGRKIYSPLVGRDREMNILELHVMKAITGEGSIVNVIGEPGVGKSRLIAELKQRESIDRALLLEGRAVSYGRNLSFHPIIEILRQWAGIQEDDSEQKALEKLERAIASLVPEGFDEILPFVALVMGIQLTGKHAQRVANIAGDALMKVTQKNIREIILKGSQKKPIVYMLEDLHWADQSSIELLISLFRLAQDNHILFVNVMRPNYRETSDRLLAAIHDKYPGLVTDVVLEPLSQHDSENLITNLVSAGNLPPRITETILKRAEGNPFFIEEVISSFLDEGAIELKDGKFKLTEKINDVLIPDSVQQILMVRIDKLDEETKSLLKIASVIGRNFFHSILAAVADAIDEIDERLECLKQIQLIRENRKMDEVEYMFKHALVQEVAYESIPPKRRKEYHLKVAQAIERIFASRLQEFSGVLAMHYSAADEKEKAEDYLLKAGEATLRSAASHEAISYFEEAMKLYLQKYGESADSNKLIMFEQNIGTALYNKGMLAEAVKHLDKALELLGDRDPKSRPALVFRALRDFLWIVKDLYFANAKKKRKPTPDDERRFVLRHMRANALANFDPRRLFFDLLRTVRWRSGFSLSGPEECSTYSLGSSLMTFSGISPSLAKRLLDRAKAAAVPDDTRSYLVYQYSYYLYHYHVGSWSINLDFDENLFRRGMDLGEFYPSCYYISFVGNIAVARGDFHLIPKLSALLHDAAEAYDSDYALLSYFNTLVYLHCNRREPQEMMHAAQVSLELQRKAGLASWMVGGEGLIARAYLLLGDETHAEEALRRSEERHAKLGTISNMFTMNPYIARLQLEVLRLEQAIKRKSRGGQPAEVKLIRKSAHRSSRLVLKQFRTLQEFKPEGYRYTGTLYWLEGKTASALKHWRKSIEAGSAMPKKQELGRTYFELGKRLLDREAMERSMDGLDGGAYFNKAKDIFTDLKLEYDLRDLESIMAHDATG